MSDARDNSAERKEIPGLGPESAKSDRNSNSAAQHEAAAFAAGTLEEISKAKEHGRTERLRDHVHLAAIVSVWVIFGLFVVGAFFLAFHHLAPKSWYWLDQDQISTLQTVLFSGSVTSAAGGYLGSRLK